MSNDNKFKSGPKKSFPATFFLFLVATLLAVVTIQNLFSTKQAKVAFSHEVEHLVNLNLVLPEESRKISQNENLVTFSGKFRDSETDEGRKRYKFLELLNLNHQLKSELDESTHNLSLDEEKIRESAATFLEISGLPIPVSGYKVIGDTFDIPDRQNAIIIKNIHESHSPNLSDLNAQFSEMKKALYQGSLTQGQADAFGAELLVLIDAFRSPSLGIGSEAIKQELKTAHKEISAIQEGDTPLTDKLAMYEKGLQVLQGIVVKLDQATDQIRLNDLRSVRQYKEEMQKHQELLASLEQNEAQLDKARQNVTNVIWFFNNRELSTRALERQDAESYSHWFAHAKEEEENFAVNKGLTFKAPAQPRTLVLEKTFKSEEPSPNYISYLFTILPVILVVFLLYFVFSRQLKGMGGNAMNFGKSPAKLMQKGQHKVTFKDVAGMDEAKEELMEIVEFLRSPNKFTTLGGRIPKGVLCIGPPGTGKTLIAKAVAGEADRPFFAIAGSDFVEMFVGVGASRIRDMFDQAKKNAPCIIFIDEIDAVGRHRGAGYGGGHDEREQTLNQLLVEMDGFDTNEGVILMAATNRPDVLDKALLRPGRFDRRVVIGLPDVKGRYDILKVHAKKIKIDPSVDLMAIARGTPGSSGADLENILNEAALLAARKGRTAVTAQETAEARDKVLYGKERRSLEMDENEKRTTAYHEAGHAVVGLCVEHADPVDKVTIIPRGLSLGATHFLPRKNRLSYWKKELVDQLAVLMGGRAAEEIFIKDMSSGAQQDIVQATKLARCMVCEWGMTENLGTIAYDERYDNSGGYGMPYHEKNYSDDTAKVIDEEVRKIVDEAYNRSKQIIQENKVQVELLTEMLIEFETLDAQDVKEILSGDWDLEKKKKRLLDSDNLYKITPPPPPSEIEPTNGPGNDQGRGLGIVGT